MRKALLYCDELLSKAVLSSILLKNDFELSSNLEDSKARILASLGFCPDIILIDTTEQKLDIVGIVRALRQYESQTQILLITLLEPELIIASSLEIGADGCIADIFKNNALFDITANLSYALIW